MSKIEINKLAAPTYRWLKVNYAELELPDDLKENEKKESELAGSAREEARITAHGNVSELRQINVKADSRALLIQRIKAETGNDLLCLNTRIDSERGSRLTIVQIIDSRGLTLVNDIKAKQADEAGIKLIQLYTGDGRVYTNIHNELSGYRSEFENDAAYLIEGSGVLDINLTVNHRGKKTKSSIDVSGSLRDKADKIFRGTIDFKKGAAGSEGAEKEDVLLIDDTVVNKTVPLILCDEEDVAGSHGATIGRLDENLVFYLGARGLDREEIIELMARARIDALIDKIPDEELRNSLKDNEEEED